MKCDFCKQDQIIYVNVIGTQQKFCQNCGMMYQDRKKENIYEMTRTGLSCLMAGGYTIDEAWNFFIKFYTMKYLINKKQIPNLLKDIQLEIDYDVYAELNKAFIELHHGSSRIPDYDLRRTNMMESVKPIDNFFLIPAVNSFLNIPCNGVRELGIIYENNMDFIDNCKRNEEYANSRQTR